MIYEHLVTGRTLPETYHKALCALQHENIELPCPNYNTNQKECSMTMFVTEPLAEPMISRLWVGDARALEQYRQEILFGILDFEIERGKWAYTYHKRFEDQIPWLIAHLQNDPHSRQAVLRIVSPEDQELESPACLQTMQFMIREGTLHCKVLLRSNDAPKAAFMNAYAFIRLQEMLAGALGIPVGTYTHRANSFHCYESNKNYEMLEGFVNAIESGREVTYNFAGDFEDQMEEAKPLIAKMVADQKAKE